MQHRALHLANAGLRRTWLVVLAAIVACSVFAAHAVAALVESSYLEAVPSSAAPPPKVEVTAFVSKPDGAELVARNMFCSTCTPSNGEPGPTDSYKPDAILIATSIGADPHATLRVSAGAQGSWGLNDVVPGVGRIERIGFTSIDVANGAQRATLSLFDSIPGGRGDAGAATPAPAAANPSADRVRKIDDYTYEVDRRLVRDLVGGSVKNAGARIAPIEKNGQLQGLRLFGVRNGGAAHSLGFKNGDVLEAVNNQKIESANTLLELYSRLEQLNTVELAGTRGGKPLTLTLRLR